jgi:hypothetical protein
MNIIEALHQEESKLESRLNAIRMAITALNGAGGRGRKAVTVDSRPKRHMSEAGRRAIAQATKKRWAEFRAEKNVKPKRTMSAATRRKISLSQRKRFAAKKV